MSKRARMEVPRNPRLAGVKEQITRARLLLEEAHAVRDYDLAFPKLIAAVYPARAAGATWSSSKYGCLRSTMPSSRCTRTPWSRGLKYGSLILQGPTSFC